MIVQVFAKLLIITLVLVTCLMSGQASLASVIDLPYSTVNAGSCCYIQGALYGDFYGDFYGAQPFVALDPYPVSLNRVHFGNRSLVARTLGRVYERFS